MAELTFAGKVGTGFSTKLRARAQKTLSKDKVDAPPVKGAPRLRDATWVKPRLVAQVEFTEWTADGKLRHPSFQGLREDKSPMETTLEKPTTPPKRRSRRRKKPGEKKRSPRAPALSARGSR